MQVNDGVRMKIKNELPDVCLKENLSTDITLWPSLHTLLARTALARKPG
jgi:hypothetical protein